MQVSVLCKERGALLSEVWQAHTTMLRTVHAKLQVLAARRNLIYISGRAPFQAKTTAAS